MQVESSTDETRDQTFIERYLMVFALHKDCQEEGFACASACG